MNIEPKKITYSLTEKEWRRAARIIFWNGFLSWAGAILIIVSLVGFNTHIFSASYPLTDAAKRDLIINSIGALGWLVIFLPVLGEFTVWRLVQSYRRTPELFTNVAWEIRDDGLLGYVQENKILIRWQDIKKVGFTREFLILFQHSRVANPLPRLSFLDGGKIWHDVIADKIKLK